GKEGHSSYPEKGLNAIYMASEFSEKLKEINEIYKVSTLNVGMIRGGVSPNSIPKNCVVEWEIRPETSSDLKKIQKEVFEKIDNILDKYKGAKSTTEIREKLLPFNYKLKNKTRDICLNSIPKSKAIKGNGAGESGYYQELGMDVVYCGPGNPDFAHKNNEYIQISELKKYCVFLKKILSSQDETK
ncbi:MAG: peptidase dimerization domain-containing protein, partial [Alphaproteobacteria bacterium]|nr:peptidase dimerization domain-containing protein [Alphaproteobacteria bacterium]